MRCWRRMEKISWTDRVGNEELLQTVKGERDVLCTVKCRKANWIGHIWRWNCLLKHVTEGKVGGGIEVTGRRGRRRKQLLNDLKTKILENEKRSTRSHAVRNSLWKRLLTCRETDYAMMMMMMMMSKNNIKLKPYRIFRQQLLIPHNGGDRGGLIVIERGNLIYLIYHIFPSTQHTNLSLPLHVST